MENDKVRQVAALTTAIGQAAVPLLLFAGGFDGPGTRLTDETINAAMPAGYAFSIWWVIFAFSIYSAVIGLRPDQLAHPGFRSIGWLMAALYGLAMLWQVIAWGGPPWATVVVIWGMLIVAVVAFIRATQFREDQRWRAAVIPGLGLYAGWVSAATWVNTADVLPMYGIGPFGLSAQGMGVAVIVAVTLTAVWVLRATRGHLAYAGAVAWALIAVIVYGGASVTPVTIAALIALLAVAALAFVFRSVR